MNERRDKHEIQAEMLRVAQKGCNKTKMVYSTHLNFNIVKRHLESLIRGGRLVQQGKRYFTTKAGLDYIRCVKAITKIIRSE